MFTAVEWGQVGLNFPTPPCALCALKHLANCSEFDFLLLFNMENIKCPHLVGFM